MSTTYKAPQTIAFQVEFFFPFPKESKFRNFDSIEEIQIKISQEKKRKKVSDRLSSTKYKNVLTPHGRQVYLERYGSLNEKELSEKLGITIGEWLVW